MARDSAVYHKYADEAILFSSCGSLVILPLLSTLGCVYFSFKFVLTVRFAEISSAVLPADVHNAVIKGVAQGGELVEMGALQPVFGY